ncbi:hypothetical protein [Streptomyces acidicola]|uniref:Uncharacterized protein n=1 Tax=Streptomyces acidicola TaxID=2596892 RepID=A0A5N8WKV3_9ACTN|nr:hypothetical protein [Streptomyces acidicola]MPY47118.1 hypothetical protein [Streptomyces acidicola]MPY47257.1 hypothetical protein [Streptomyces acidicola]
MSPYLLSADLGVTELGQRARATTTVAEATVLSITDLFAAFAEARAAGDQARMDAIRAAAALDPALAAELDGFDYEAAA